MSVTVAVDAMGGDFAPGEVVAGTLAALSANSDLRIVLVGDERSVNETLSVSGTTVPETLSVRATTEVIAMHEHPVQAMRKKRNSSLVVAAQMVKAGEADATFSAGNTGAAMAIATFDIGRIPGIERPAIAATLPTVSGSILLLDAGANVDCSPQNLLQFALLGSVYAERAMGCSNPSIGLLNIGGEEGKGNELSKTAYSLLQNSGLSFHGNVEGKDVFEHAADVVVCDGFAGNVLLKTGEGVAEMIVTLLKQEMNADPATASAAEIFKPILHRLMKRIDYAHVGGAPLLGINGVSFIGHGRSKAKAIASGVLAAAAAAQSGYVAAVRDALPNLKGGA